MINACLILLLTAGLICVNIGAYLFGLPTLLVVGGLTCIIAAITLDKIL